MTHKQIIIDGVDVSECAGYYFSPTGFHSCQDIQQVNNLGYEQDTLCEQNPNCCYKKLKRKEQECEELKDKLNCCFCNPHIELNDTDKQRKCIEVTECFRRQLDQLKAENEKLNSLLKLRIEDLCDSCGASSMMPMPCKVYEKTLTEIKEIAKPYQRDIHKICGYCRKYDSCHACCIDDLKYYEYRTGTTKACERFVELERFNINIVANKILQKISECEVEDDR